MRGLEPQKPSVSLENAIIPPKKEKPRFVPTEFAKIEAIKHCAKMENSITEHFLLIDAFNYTPPADEAAITSDAEKEKYALYLMNRPDIADFSYMIPTTWRTTPRDLRVKFNAIMNLKIASELGFRFGGYRFHNNCKITKETKPRHRNGYSYLTLTTPFAFDTTEASLVYFMEKQDGYNWQISDITFNGFSQKKNIAKMVDKNGLKFTISQLCKNSGFGTLKCD